MINVDNIITALWEPFISQIESGMPVYFTFHHALLINIFKDQQLSHEDPISVINSCVKRFITVKNNFVFLTDDALCPLNVRFSPAIIFICQQVLAVEQMVKEEGSYSDKAYFPRLRAMMSPELEMSHSNPFKDFKQFVNIWKTVRKEMRQINGLTTSTFSFGFYKGINKARQFAFSQCLFTREDLECICRNIDLDYIRTSSLDRILHKINSSDISLPKRTTDLLKWPDLRKAAIMQLIEFSKNVDQEQLLRGHMQSSNRIYNELYVFKDPCAMDLLIEEYAAYLYNQVTEERNDEQEEIYEFLKIKLNWSNGFAFLPRATTGDCWVIINRYEEVTYDDSFLLIAMASATEKAREHLLKQVGNNFLLDEGHAAVIKFGEETFKIFEVVNKNCSKLSLWIKNGQQIYLEQSNVKKFEWIGGACLNKRINLYIYSSLPNSIRFGDIEYSIYEVIRISSRDMKFDVFMNEVQNLTYDTTYSFEFPDGNTANISIAISRESTSKFKLGFKIENYRFIHSVPTYVDTDEPYLRGFCFRNIHPEPIPIYLIVKLIRTLLAVPAPSGGLLSKETSDKILYHAMNSVEISQLNDLLKFLMSRNVILPSDLQNAIESYL